jgi:hypothetical protein
MHRDEQIERPCPAPGRPPDAQVAIFDGGRDYEQVDQIAPPVGEEEVLEPFFDRQGDGLAERR